MNMNTIEKLKLFLATSDTFKLFLISSAILAFAAPFAMAQFGAPPGSSQLVQLSQEFCNIVNDVRTIIGVFALVMFLIGGILYAAGHFLPSTGQVKGTAMGWAMGMIIGGIIGLILVIIAPFVIGQIAAFGNGGGYVSITSQC
jgi:hypothetical protein